jgi:osmotically-inducible protein OsmY
MITTKVKAAIFNDSTLKVDEINVARGVAGAKSVENDMRIK